MSLLRFSRRSLLNKLCINSDDKILKYRSFKNFGHNEDKEPLVTKLYAIFIGFPFIFLPINWPWIKGTFLEAANLKTPYIPASYYPQEDD